jgi:hypothetical protein
LPTIYHCLPKWLPNRGREPQRFVRHTNTQSAGTLWRNTQGLPARSLQSSFEHSLIRLIAGNETSNSTSKAKVTLPRRSGRNSSFVANSSDNEEDIAHAAPPTALVAKLTGRRFLQSVVIPAMTSDSGSRRETVASASSRSSLGSSTRDNSIGYDTPVSTTANTPAADASITSTRRNLKLGGIPLHSSNKRKRGSQTAPTRSNDTSRDEELALAMQEEEYKSPAASEAGPSLTRRDNKRNFVDLGDDSDGDDLKIEVR